MIQLRRRPRERRDQAFADASRRRHRGRSTGGSDARSPRADLLHQRFDRQAEGDPAQPRLPGGAERHPGAVVGPATRRRDRPHRLSGLRRRQSRHGRDLGAAAVEPAPARPGRARSHRKTDRRGARDACAPAAFGLRSAGAQRRPNPARRHLHGRRPGLPRSPGAHRGEDAGYRRRRSTVRPRPSRSRICTTATSSPRIGRP